MRVADLMSTKLVRVRRAEPAWQAARTMDERGVSAAVVEPDSPEDQPGIVTVRDVLELVASGGDPARARVEDHHTPNATTAGADWPLERAAEAMVAGGFRHLIVLEDQRIAGVVSIHDIIRRWAEQRAHRPVMIQIREAMNRDYATIDRDATIREAARVMADRARGAAVLLPPRRRRPPEIITERDVLQSVAAAQDPDASGLGGRRSRTTFSAPDWSLEQAAEAMIKGGFQHVVVVDREGVVGIIAMRDILTRWLGSE